MSSYIIAWDPGQTTGVCVGVQDSAAPGGFRVVANHAVLWIGRFARIQELTEQYRPRITIIEPFTLYKHKAKDQVGSRFPSSQVVGIIETFLYIAGLPAPAAYQPASLIHGKPPVQILREHAPLIGPTDHERDAYKHLRYYVEDQARLARISAHKAAKATRP